MKKETKEDIAANIKCVLFLAAQKQEPFRSTPIWINGVRINLEPGFTVKDYINYNLEWTKEDYISVKIVNYSAVDIDIHTVDTIGVGSITLNIKSIREKEKQ